MVRVRKATVLLRRTIVHTNSTKSASWSIADRSASLMKLQWLRRSPATYSEPEILSARWAVVVCYTRALKSETPENRAFEEKAIGCQRKKIQKHGTLTKDTKLRHVQNKVCVVDSKTCWNIRCATKS